MGNERGQRDGRAAGGELAITSRTRRARNSSMTMTTATDTNNTPVQYIHNARPWRERSAQTRSRAPSRTEEAFKHGNPEVRPVHTRARVHCPPSGELGSCIIHYALYYLGACPSGADTHPQADRPQVRQIAAYGSFGSTPRGSDKSRRRCCSPYRVP